jgi:serine beta-lactamase-like protein LACTB, mitochondrial
MRRCVLRVILSLLFTACAYAQAALPVNVVHQIDQIVEQAREKDHLPAVSVAIAIHGEVVFKKAFGYADLENNVVATPETLFRTASIAKSMTAVGALELTDQGKLNLDVPIQKYCPAFPEKPWPITTRELLGHLAGIREYQNREIFSTVHYVNTIDGMSFFKNDPLLFEPGTKYAYTTFGYTVVGCVMEGASNEKYFEYMLEHVFRPAGMEHTFVDDVFTIVPHRASGYAFLNGRVINAPLTDSSYKIPGGGLVSTPEDLVKFGSAIMAGKLLKPQTVTEMWTPQKTRDGASTHYGMGWGKAELDGETIYAHSGSQPGTRTSLFVIPSRKMAFALMVNMDNVDAPGLNREIGEVVLKAMPPGRGQ